MPKQMLPDKACLDVVYDPIPCYAAHPDRAGEMTCYDAHVQIQIGWKWACPSIHDGGALEGFLLMLCTAIERSIQGQVIIRTGEPRPSAVLSQAVADLAAQVTKRFEANRNEFTDGNTPVSILLRVGLTAPGKQPRGWLGVDLKLQDVEDEPPTEEGPSPADQPA